MGRAAPTSQSREQKSPVADEFGFARSPALKRAPVNIFDQEVGEMEEALERRRPRSASAAHRLLQDLFPNAQQGARAQACEAYARSIL